MKHSLTSSLKRLSNYSALTTALSFVTKVPKKGGGLLSFLKDFFRGTRSGKLGIICSFSFDKFPKKGWASERELLIQNPYLKPSHTPQDNLKKEINEKSYHVPVLKGPVKGTPATKDSCYVAPSPLLLFPIGAS